MCGFCLSVGDGAADIHGLTESIKHRGPDSTKYFIGPQVLCGFNRLAIVDQDERSDQPMLDGSGRYLLAFNGEIYNHAKLRVALAERYGETFVTQSDTEVLLKGLILEGVQFVTKLDGIFAFAFVDLQSLEAVLARDTFGIKPLYYHLRGGQLYVSSEVRPLQRLLDAKLQLSNIAGYLSYGIVGNGEAIASGIAELEPNCVKRFRSGALIETIVIHEFAYNSRPGIAVSELRHLLDETIASQRPGIPYGVLFSGGLNSTLILEGCAGDGHLSGAYSVDVDHPDMSERRWQEHAIARLDLADRYRKVELGRQDFSVENIARISHGLDYPLFHPNFIGSFLLTKMARDDGLKVLLSGEGADELFLGYRWFFADQPPSEFLEYVPADAMASLLGVSSAATVDTAGLSLLEIFQRIYIRRWLLRQDMTGMANSVEVRVPFLGMGLADLVNQLTFEFKKGGESKWIIKTLLEDRYPKEFVRRKKVGFDFPLNDWIGEEHVDFLQREADGIDRSALNAMLQAYEGSYMRNRIIFSAVSFAVWQKSLGSRSLVSTSAPRRGPGEMRPASRAGQVKAAAPRDKSEGEREARGDP